MKKVWAWLLPAVLLVLSGCLVFSTFGQLAAQNSAQEEETRRKIELEENFSALEIELGIQEGELSGLKEKLDSLPEEAKEQLALYAGWEKWSRELEEYLDESR